MKHLSIFVALVALFGSVQAAQQDNPATTAKWRKYYSEHLPEAKKMLEACVAKGFNKTQGEERIKCDTARDAWQFQPYKPTPPAFSSSGGRH